MQIYYDSLVSYTIWFTIDCIYETVMLRFDSILCQLEKQSISYPVPIAFFSIWFNLRIILIESLVISFGFDFI
jgi:hypothetical protein